MDTNNYTDYTPGTNNNDGGGQPQSNNNYGSGQQQNHSQSGGGYQGGGQKSYQKKEYGNGGGGFKKKGDTIPKGIYLPYGLIVKKDVTLPQEAIDNLKIIVRTLDERGFILRKEFGPVVDDITPSKVETYLAWADFKPEGYNEPPKATYNPSKQNKETLADLDPFFGDLSPGQIAFMATDVAILTGVFNNSACRFLLTYTNDGCVDKSARTDNTGYAYKTILYANRLGIPIVNLHDPHCKDTIDTILSAYKT